VLPPKSCYSIHQDYTPRVHIPIVSNTNNVMVWPSDNVNHTLLTGRAYWTDTTKNHTFVNADSLIERIHLVMCVES